MNSEMQISTRIDWISATLLHLSLVGECIPITAWEEIAGRFNYDLCHRDENGVIILSCEDRFEMGTHVIFSATALDNIEMKHGIDPIELIKRLYRQNAKFTRLDIALDIKNGEFSISKLVEQYEAGNAKTLARKGFVIKNIGETGQTLYIGKRGSRKLLRVYDKAAQLELNGDWVRIELELRKDAANKAVKSLLIDCQWTNTIPKLIKGFVDFPESRDWQIVTGKNAIKITAPTETESQTRKWLLETCAPSIARLFIEGDRNILNDVLNRSSDLIRKNEKAVKWLTEEVSL